MAKVTIQFLGTGDAFGSGGRLQTCILVAGETQCLLDCGATAIIAMNQHDIDPNNISTIFLTHLHGDHASGIPFFILDAQLNRKRTQPLTIVGPQGTTAWYPQIMEALFPGSAGVARKFSVDIKEFTLGTAATVNSIIVEPFAVEHGNLTALALRIHFQNKIISYSGDTQWTDSLPAAARGADLFIAEAYFFDKLVKNHLAYATLQAHRDELKAKRTILTHMGSDMLKRVNGIDVETANDGMIIEI